MLRPSWRPSGSARARTGLGGAYLIGLTKWRIPEVQVVGSAREPGDLLSYLMDIVGCLLGGARIRAGETLARDEREKITTSWQPSILDEEGTALQREMRI